MRFAHLADLHLGSWRDQKIRDISTQAFLKAIDDCICRKVDFVLFAGDLFNTSIPPLDILKIVTKKLNELKQNNIPLYVIAGSHDFSPRGKTILDVLENAGLMINVCKGSVNPGSKQLELKFTIDSKTKTKITGVLGRRGLLDKTYYENLNREVLENQNNNNENYKIFMFHTTITELKPKHLEIIESQPASFLPKGFNYYAGGHIHHPTKIEVENIGTLTYPGALFPNNFLELEKYSNGGYYLIDYNENINTQNIEWVPVKIIEHEKLILDCKRKSAIQINQEIKNHFSNKEIKNKIVTIRLFGELIEGRSSDINFPEITDWFYQKGTSFVMRNTSKLSSKEFEEIKINTKETSLEETEEKIIKEHLQQINLFDKNKELQLVKELIQTLNTKKQEGEKNYDFDEKICKEIEILMNH